MRVLVTRPRVSAEKTAGRLTDLGHAAVLLPLSEAVHDPQAAIEALRMPHAAVAITSAEALRVLAHGELRPILDLGRPLFPVGASTASAARAAGFLDVRAGASNGHELAGLIAASVGTDRSPVLYLAGRPRSPSFENRLTEMSVAVAIREIYEMRTVEYKAAEIAERVGSSPLDAVLLYSRESARHFFRQIAPLRPEIGGLRIICISEQAATVVPAPLRRNVIIAKSPEEGAMFALL